MKRSKGDFKRMWAAVPRKFLSAREFFILHGYKRK